MTITDTKDNQPSHIVWQIIDSKASAKGVFRRVGAAWPNRKGNGFNVVMEAIPLTGRIAILERDDDEPSQAGDTREPSAPAP